MFKRLIIAVLALGLMMAFSGTAFSDVNTKPANDAAFNGTNPNVARFAQLKKAKQAFVPANRLANNTVKAIPGNPNIPVHNGAPAYSCGWNAYHNGTPALYWRVPDQYAAPFEMVLPAVRFSTDPGIRCTLKTASILVYRTQTKGNPGMRVYLYDDDGFGFPGAKLDSVDFPLGSFLGSGLVWADADFSPAGWVFENGEEYHIAIAPITNSADDSLAYISDDGTGHTASPTFRNNMYLAGAGYNVWTDMASIWVTPTDYGFVYETETCCAEIPFSDCYSQSYNGAAFYIWPTPDALYGDSAYAMRFSVGGPETLSSVNFGVFNATASGTARKGSAYIFGDDAIHVTVYDDDGFGLPGTQLAQVTIPGGSYAAYPALVTANFAPLVLTSTFHVALSTTGTTGLDCEAFISDNGTSASGRGSDCTPGFPWGDMLSVWGLDAAFLMTANLCRDEFSQCSYIDAYDNTTQTYPVPDANPITEWAQKFTAVGANCELRDVAIDFWWRFEFDAGRATKMYTKNTAVHLYADAAGSPGALLGTVVLTPADYAAAGNVGFNPSVSYAFTVHANFDPLNINFAGDYWVSVEPLTAVRDSGIRLGIDADGGPLGGPDYLSAFASAFGGWLGVPFGSFSPNSGMVATAYHCCIPFAERACSGSSDWPRFGGDNASDGRSQVALSDSWCDLNRLWSYSETNASAATVSGVGPIIYQGKVVSNFYDRYEKFDLASGTLLFTWGPGGTNTGGFPLGTQLLSSGTVATVAGTDMLFLGGGSNNNLIAVNWTSNAVVWGIGLGPNQGPVRGGAFIVLNQAGTDILYYVTNSGNVVARVASTGALWGGWTTNPVSLGGNASEVTGATDGTNLYFSTAPASPAFGSVYKINAATGAIMWSVPSGNLKGTTVYPTEAVTREIFNAGVSTDGANVYAVSAVPTGNGNFPSEGVYYKLDANTGNVTGFAASESSIRQSPVIDQNRVMVISNSRWGGGTLGLTTIIAYDKAFSTISWLAEHPEEAAQRARAAALSCEPLGVADKLYVLTDAGWMFTYDADNGDEIFQRRWENLGSGTNTAPKGIAIGNGPYVALTTRNQFLITLTKGADRPRLEFLTFNPSSPVDFGSNPALPLNLGPILTNTGCTNLNIGTVTADENPFVARIPTFSIKESVVAQAMRSGRIADMIAANQFSAKGVELVTPDVANEFSAMTGIEGRDNRNRAASAVPPWLVSIVDPSNGDVVAPGDTMNLNIVVDQNLISRGPQTAYVQVASDDPDYFLNDPTGKPQFKMTLIGGCLLDTTHLDFGVGSANFQIVYNSGRIGEGDNISTSSVAGAFDIDGAFSPYYQGSYVYAVSQRRWAVNVSEWFSNVTDELISLQADPNWCDTTCKPYLTSPYNVGSISSNGITYTPIDANMVCRSYIDSVQNFDDGAGGWDVTQYSAAPFDNDSTMGLYVKSHVVGAVDEPQLANVTVDIMSITERNGRSLPGFFLGSMNDIDLGGGDTVGMDQSISAAYSWRKTGANGIWGQIKLPFGCGQAPTINTRGLGGQQAFFASGVGLNAYFDSAYQFMQAPSGSITSQTSPNSSGNDFEQVITHYGHSFTANETVQLGVAFFGYPNLSNATTTTTSAPTAVKDMARLVNKWTGWGRGDVNNDNVINLGDIVYLAAYVNFSGPGPIPFMHLGDVNASGGAPNQADVTYMINYYFNCGPCPTGAFVF